MERIFTRMGVSRYRQRRIVACIAKITINLAVHARPIIAMGIGHRPVYIEARPYLHALV